MSIKKSNRGGSRPGAGRKPAFETSSTGETIDTYKPKINPVKELEKLYKELAKVKTKDELLIVQAKIDLLNKLLPYTAMKKPTASLDEGKEVIPEMTVLKVIDGGETDSSAQQETPKEENSDEEDFV